MREPIPAGTVDAAAVLGTVEWLALGFEIIDCPYAAWTFQPADFVAAYGLHRALVIGTPMAVEPAGIPALVETLATFTVRLLKDGALVAEGSGRNSLRSPALCLGELAAAIRRRDPSNPLAAGELVSSGTLTESQALGAGETWTAIVEGLAVSNLQLTTHN
jgi:2-oxo-3-hexenedioate decarboxylase